MDDGVIYAASVSVIGVGDVKDSEVGLSALTNLDTASSLLRFRTWARRSFFSDRSFAFSASSFSSLSRSSAIGILPAGAGGSAFCGATLFDVAFAAGTLAAMAFIGADLITDFAVSAFFAVGAGFDADFAGVFAAGFAETGGAFTDFGFSVDVVAVVTLTGMDFDGAGLGFSADVGLVLDDPLIPRGMAIP